MTEKNKEQLACWFRYGVQIGSVFLAFILAYAAVKTDIAVLQRGWQENRTILERHERILNDYIEIKSDIKSIKALLDLHMSETTNKGR